MLVIPAIDLKEGKCVRLREGKMEEETIFSDDPLLDTQKENRKHAIKYVDNMMERYGITRDEAFLKILESKTAKNHPNS